MNALFFERTMQLFFGDKAYQIAGYSSNVKERVRWLLKAICQMKKQVNSLDTTIQHQEQLMGALEKVEKCLKKEGVDWLTIDSLFYVCAVLFGRTNVQARFYTVSYWQDECQYLTQKLVQGDDKALRGEKENAIAKKREIIKQLKAEGVGTFEIALIFNISEYQVKKILKASK